MINRIVSLLFAFVALGFLGLVIYAVPIASEMIKCYDVKINSFDEVEYRSRANGWRQDAICKVKKESILTLEQCVNNVEEKFTFPQKGFEYLKELLPIIRPTIEPLSVLKSSHDRDCWEYPAYIFSPAE